MIKLIVNLDTMVPSYLAKSDVFWHLTKVLVDPTEEEMWYFRRCLLPLPLGSVCPGSPKVMLMSSFCEGVQGWTRICMATKILLVPRLRGKKTEGDNVMEVDEPILETEDLSSWEYLPCPCPSLWRLVCISFHSSFTPTSIHGANYWHRVPEDAASSCVSWSSQAVWVEALLDSDDE